MHKGGTDIEFFGAKIDDPAVKSFKSQQLKTQIQTRCMLGIAPHDDTGETYVDRYAVLLRSLFTTAISTTASEPEHKISYINIISENDSKPEYDDMAIVGLNIRSSKELRNLDQLSVYCEKGIVDSDGENDLSVPRRFQ